MTKKPTVLCIINSETSQPRRLHGWLLDAGLDVEVVLGTRHELPTELNSYSGLMMFGGGLMPHDDEKAPWLIQERVLAKQAIETDIPTLGICLGGQILAQVAGGEVKASYGMPEVGSINIRLTEEGEKDPVSSALGKIAPMIEFHQDQITRLPADATLLARSADVENQLFRLGENVYALQFHPEASAIDTHFWDAEEVAELGFNLARLQTKADQVHTRSTQAAYALTQAWIEKVLTYHA